MTENRTDTIPDTIPETMRAFALHGHGGLDCLRLHRDWPTPQPGPGQLLLRVSACGLNNTDVNTRTGWYSGKVRGPTTGEGETNLTDDDTGGWDGGIDFPRIQGGDVTGRVVALGAGLDGDGDTDLLGQRVLVDTIVRDWDDPMNRDACAYLGSALDGGFADYMVIDRRNVHPVTCDWQDAELATVAIAYSTAENMLERASVGAGDTVLIPGASGGVGSALIQLARRRGAVTVAMASEAKHEALAVLKPTAMLPRRPDDLKAALRRAIGREHVSVVADVVGGPQFPALLEVLARGGRYTCSGAIAGPVVELDLRTLYLRDLSFFGNTIFAPSIFPSLVRYIEAGEIVPMLAATWPLEELQAAQRAFIDKKHTGNIVVVMT